MAEKHLGCAKQQRGYHRKQVNEAKDSVKSGTLQTRTYSFDHAQQVHYPSNPQQPGPVYFKVPRRCGIFGVCDEGNSSQINYLIDEAQSCGKGANSIIESVDSICRDSADTQYMLIQSNFSKSPKQLTYKLL